MKEVNRTIGNHWSSVTNEQTRQASSNQLKLRWWQSPYIIRHINRLVCGEDIPGVSQGLVQLLSSRVKNLPFKRGISVGAGTGQKEMRLIKQNIVERFDLYEYSEDRISQGMKIAVNQSLEEKVTFVHGDAFDLVSESEQYDFVHWNNSLHHMFDVRKAVVWSKKVLKPGGVFFMDDFIGASRFQWPVEQTELASRIRKIFEGSKYITNRRNGGVLSTNVAKPSIQKLIEVDPSEAADSSRIVEAVYENFPNAEIRITGGVVYHLALNDMLANFDEEEDKVLLDLLMIIDEMSTKLGQTHYGVALAFKED